MMHPLRKHLACLLAEAARDGIKGLDKDSIQARELRALDVDAALKEDINRICAAITFSELASIISLTAQLKSECGDEKRLKEEMKKIARKLMQRAESKGGSLNIPPSCRDLLFEL